MPDFLAGYLGGQRAAQARMAPGLAHRRALAEAQAARVAKHKEAEAQMAKALGLLPAMQAGDPGAQMQLAAMGLAAPVETPQQIAQREAEQAESKRRFEESMGLQRREAERAEAREERMGAQFGESIGLQREQAAAQQARWQTEDERRARLEATREAEKGEVKTRARQQARQEWAVYRPDATPEELDALAESGAPGPAERAKWTREQIRIDAEEREKRRQDAIDAAKAEKEGRLRDVAGHLARKKVGKFTETAPEAPKPVSPDEVVRAGKEWISDWKIRRKREIQRAEEELDKARGGKVSIPILGLDYRVGGKSKEELDRLRDNLVKLKSERAPTLSDWMKGPSEEWQAEQEKGRRTQYGEATRKYETAKGEYESKLSAAEKEHLTMLEAGVPAHMMDPEIAAALTGARTEAGLTAKQEALIARARKMAAAGNKEAQALLKEFVGE